jgi:hypothetical protein
MGKIIKNVFSTHRAYFGTGESQKNPDTKSDQPIDILYPSFVKVGSDQSDIQDNNGVEILLPAGVGQPDKPLTDNDIRKLKEAVEDAGGMLPSGLNADIIFKRNYADDPVNPNDDPDFVEPLLPAGL